MSNNDMLGSAASGHAEVKPTVADPKRIVVACDGTWDDSDRGYDHADQLPWGKLVATPPSNVTRICRCIKPQDDKSRRQQIVYYQAGIGSENNVIDKVWGGLKGFGIGEHVREAYAFLCHNYREGDEIILFGFSRGAFTARTIAAMIYDIGLLSMRGMTYFYPIFKDWENKIHDKYVSPFQEPFPPDTKKPRFGDSYLDFLVKKQWTTRNIPIKCIGVWDTVGSLGIPSFGIFPSSPASEFTFVDTKVAPNVSYAFQALALDEHRLPFTPTIWETPEGDTTLQELKQCWFAGAHADVGGGYPDTMGADITLAWMISQLQRHDLLDFDLEYLKWAYKNNLLSYGHNQRAWGMGKINESMTGLYKATHKLVRHPATYYETDPVSGQTTKTPCRLTNEHVHASVRVRLGMGGKGLDDSGTYAPEALKGWSCKGVTGEPADIYWEQSGEDEPKRMPEDKLSDLENTLLDIANKPAKVDLWSSGKDIEL